MDQQQVCHEVALESAKAYVNANMPEYINSKGLKGYAADMTRAYLDAYEAAKEVFAERNEARTARII